MAAWSSMPAAWQVQFDYGTRRPMAVSDDLRRLLEEDMAAFPVPAVG
jgi:hypothetical protein